MGINTLGIHQLAAIGQQDRLNSAGRYREFKPSPIIGLIARVSGIVAGGASAVERWASHASGRTVGTHERAGAR